MSPPAPVLSQREQRRFEILEELGRGGFGVVYRARLVAGAGFNKIVAIKVLNREVTANSEAAVRLRDEARMLGLLRHPALVQVDGLIELDGGWAVVMEYVPGLDLTSVLRRGPVPLRPALEIVAQVALALDCAWRTPGPHGGPLRLIHRDVKPANIRVTPEGAVKLLDFGIARAEFEARELTRPTGFIGTIGFMAPERLDARDGPEGDVYALGCVLFQLITGKANERASGDRVRHQERVEDAMAALQDALPDANAELAGLVGATLQFDTAERPTARELALALEGLADTVKGPRLRRWAARALTEDPAEVGQAPNAAILTLVEESADTFHWVEPPGRATARARTSPPSGAGSVLPMRLIVAGLAVGLLLGAIALGTALILWRYHEASPVVAPPPSSGLVVTSPSEPPASAVELAQTAPTQPEPSAPQTEPKPAEPVVVASTAPRASKTQAAKPALAHVTASGDARYVELISTTDGTIVRLPADVAAGNYKIHAVFSDGAGTTGGSAIHVDAGSAARVSCTGSPFYKCKLD